ncbi:MAG: hypothetical protein NWE95_05505 [Candidatus Bathyarchaeota archaeon]|nr:hypothetical protein [Candidatus Bathyarchaeota archaeon]
MTQEPIAKKRNKTVIALAIICIILAASLIGVIAVYQPTILQEELAEKDALISSLQAQIGSLQYQLAQAPNATTYQAQITSLNQQITILNDTLTSAYASIVSMQRALNLELTALLFDDSFTQNANTTTEVWTNIVETAGYITIAAQATANTTYAEILFVMGETNFNYNQTIGTSGTAIFPVLPGTVQIKIGNINQAESNSVNATIRYYY